jgi:aldehyde dehydrogenase (NAD+)
MFILSLGWAGHLQRLPGVDEGRQEGAEVVTGGYRLDRKGYFLHPTVLTGVSTGARLYREEIFGPVVAVLPFDDEDEAGLQPALNAAG